MNHTSNDFLTFQSQFLMPQKCLTSLAIPRTLLPQGST
jgi:hypothetical protein